MTKRHNHEQPNEEISDPNVPVVKGDLRAARQEVDTRVAAVNLLIKIVGGVGAVGAVGTSFLVYFAILKEAKAQSDAGIVVLAKTVDGVAADLEAHKKDEAARSELQLRQTADLQRDIRELYKAQVSAGSASRNAVLEAPPKPVVLPDGGVVR